MTANGESVRSRIASIKNSIRTSPRPLRRFQSLVLKRTGLCRMLTIDQQGFRLRFYPSALSTTLWCDTKARDEDVRAIQRMLPVGGVYVDVGANIGQLVLAGAARVGPNGQVVAVEAHPTVFHYLTGNIALNPELAPVIRAHHLAVGVSDGVAAFSSNPSDDCNRVTSNGAINVPMGRLDVLIEDLPHIDLLKVDVEGYELFVLQGATNRLDVVSAIYFEYFQKHFDSFGYEGGEILDMLATSGFCVYSINGELLEVVDRNAPPSHLVNLLAVRDTETFCQLSRYCTA